MKYYYTNALNQPVGPVDVAELTRLASQGVITDQTSVLLEGSQQWTNYGVVRQGFAASAATQAVVANISRAADGLKNFSWGDLLFGLLLSFIGYLCLPWTVLKLAAHDLAKWGRERLLPSAQSDLPVLTFLVIILRNVAIVLWVVVVLISAILALSGHGPFYRSWEWNIGYALGGFFGGLIVGYLGIAAVALWFEFLSLGVRIANDVKTIARR